MFFVYRFTGELEDFEAIGCFTKKDEAEALAITFAGEKLIAHVVERTWRQAVDQATTMRLGPVAEALTALGIKIGD